MTVLAEMFRSSGNCTEYVARYVARVADLIRGLDPSTVARCAETLEHAAQQGRVIYCVANGGSAAVASHFVNDLGPNSFAEGSASYRVHSLADNVESITAIANDFGYDEIFRYQLRSLLQPGDVVLAMSVSGNSENLVRAAEFAKERGAAVLAWTGFDGGRLARISDVTVHIPTTGDEYGPVEGIFSHLAHAISGYVAMKRGRPLAHVLPEHIAATASK